MPIDLYRIQSATERANAYAKDSVDRVAAYLIDDIGYTQRTAESVCQWCWYRQKGRVSGQAFTEYTCANCGEIQSWPNTGVPQLCDFCATKHRLCKECCGTVDGSRRKVFPRKGDK